MKTAKTLAVLLFLATMPALTEAAQQRPAFMQPEVIRAAVDIGMSDEQMVEFRANVGEFIDGRIKAFNDLMRRNNVTHMDRKMKSRTKKLRRRMDKQMKELLTEEQYSKYEVYRNLLMSHMRGA